MPNYQESKIYKVVCNKTKLVYIGSTTRLICERKSQHISSFKKWCEGEYKYLSIFDVMENNDYTFSLVENYPCDNEKDLYSRERYWIENTICVNISIPYRSEEEKYTLNNAYELSRKDTKKEYLKEYRKNHREEAKKYASNQREKAKKNKMLLELLNQNV